MPSHDPKERIVSLCKRFVMSMVDAENALREMQTQVPKDQRRAALEEVLTWVTTSNQIPPDSYSREVAREILAQLSALAMYDDFQGSPDAYIQ